MMNAMPRTPSARGQSIYEVMLIIACAAMAVALFFAAYEYVSFYHGPTPYGSEPAATAPSLPRPVARPPAPVAPPTPAPATTAAPATAPTATPGTTAAPATTPSN
jgi:hypothetical protein